MDVTRPQPGPQTVTLAGEDEKQIKDGVCQRIFGRWEGWKTVIAWLIDKVKK
jgi:hypothetical protein